MDTAIISLIDRPTSSLAVSCGEILAIGFVFFIQMHQSILRARNGWERRQQREQAHAKEKKYSAPL